MVTAHREHLISKRASVLEAVKPVSRQHLVLDWRVCWREKEVER